jgi:hypothetical protein
MIRRPAGHTESSAFQVSRAQSKAEMPNDKKDDDLLIEMPSIEQV